MAHRKIETYQQAFCVIGVDYTDEWRKLVAELEAKGHTVKSICYAIWRTRDTLYDLRRHPDFKRIFLREINRYSWDKHDPRWQEYNRRKQKEREIAAEIVKNTALIEKEEANNG